MIRNAPTGCATVTTSPAALMASKATMPFRGIKVRAPRTNTAPVYISFNAGLTADTTEATAGWPVEPGQEEVIETSEPESLFTRTSAGTQYLHWAIS